MQGPPLARAALLGAAALALATAAPAAAAPPRKEPAAPRAPAAARAAPPAARAAPPAARAAPPAAAPLPAAPAVPPAGAERPRGGWLAVHGGAWVGLDAGQSLALLVDYGLDRTPAAWRRLELELHLSALVARPTDEVELTRTVAQPYPYPPLSVPSGLETTEAWVAEVVPSARVRLPFQKFALFADAGLGLAQSVERVERDETFAGVTTTTENVTGLVLRAGAGMSFDLSPRTRLVFVPVALSVHLGPSYSAYTPSLGLSYRP